MHISDSTKTLDTLLHNDFTSFVDKVFTGLNPSVDYLRNWHIDLIAEYLEAVRNKEVQRLIINMPPRSLKSLCISVAWPAWLLGQDPSSRILVASYAASLSLKHSVECRNIIEALWYQRVFDQARITKGENQKHKFVMTKRGYRFATSIDGSVTGEGGDYLIVDDPLTPMQAHAKRMRQRVNTWFDTTFSTRLDQKKEGAIILVMQRLHAQDLSGYLLEKGGWEHLCLPAIAPKKLYFNMHALNKESMEGEILHAGREGAELLKRAEQELGAMAYTAQYLQVPLHHEHAIIKPSWFPRYRGRPNEIIRIIQSWDTAIKAGINNDATVCATFAQTKEAHYLLDIKKIKIEYPQLRRLFVALAAEWQPDAILVEDKASGQQLLQDIRHEELLPVIPIQPRLDKLTRLIQVSAMVEAGKVFLPSRASWLEEFEQELYAFPEGEHDDEVDAFTQYLLWARKLINGNLRIRKM